MSSTELMSGFITIDKEERPFYFDNIKFQLFVYPATIDAWERDRFEFIGKMERNLKQSSWTNQRRVEGKLSNNNHVFFKVYNCPQMINGYRVYQVAWAVELSGSYDLDAIESLCIFGGDVNFFYPVERVWEKNALFTRNKTKLREVRVKAKNDMKECAGMYRVARNTDAEIFFSIYPRLSLVNQRLPLSADSYIQLNYSSPVGIETAIRNISDFKHLLCYSSYINNIGFQFLQLGWKSKKAQYVFAGNIYLPGNTLQESRESLNMISYSFWKSKMKRILTDIKNEKLTYQHICASNDERRHYNSSRCMMIFVAFEREFRNYYSVDFSRSEEYKEMKSSIVNLITEMATQKHGKEKRYLKQIAGFINSKDDSFEKKVETALKDNYPVISPFLLTNYVNKQERDIQKIAKRLGNLRNAITHARLDMKFSPANLGDVKILEELIYAIRLRRFNSEVEVKKAIKLLFNEKSASI